MSQALSPVPMWVKMCGETPGKAEEQLLGGWVEAERTAGCEPVSLVLN